jgi:Fe-S cluster assembly protein SufD
MADSASGTETEAERAFREGAEALIGRAPPAQAQARRAALAAFMAAGLPDRRREEFHYTDLRAKLRDPYKALVGEDRVYLSEKDVAEWGQRARQSIGDEHAHVHAILNGGAIGEGEVSGGDFNKFDPLAALNTALTLGGASVRIPAGEAAAIILDHRLIAVERVSVHPRHVIEVGEGARLTMIECHRPSNDHLTDEQMQITLAEGAQIDHIKLLAEGDAVHTAGVHATLAAGAAYSATILALGTRLARHAVTISLEGEGAAARLRGVVLATGEEHLDLNVRVDHNAPHCLSETEIRAVATERGRAAIQSLVRVAPRARGSDGRQLIRGLILSPRAEIDAKPELEILNDDVKCSHGTALGDLDAEAIFYLRARGVPEAAARALLAEAFLASLIERVQHEGARDMLLQSTRTWLAHAFNSQGFGNG